MLIHDYTREYYSKHINEFGTLVSDFSTFNGWASYISNFSRQMRNNVGSIPNNVASALAGIGVNITRIYGFELNETLEYILDYFIDRRWEYLDWRNV